MGLPYAIDELYATGWQALDSAGCAHDADGRSYPSVPTVRALFQQAGLTLEITFVSLFDCYRASWTDAAGTPRGAVVGATGQEAAVYALAQLRRATAAV